MGHASAFVQAHKVHLQDVCSIVSLHVSFAVPQEEELQAREGALGQVQRELQQLGNAADGLRNEVRVMAHVEDVLEPGKHKHPCSRKLSACGTHAIFSTHLRVTSKL